MAWALGAFFIVGGIVNAIPRQAIRQQYALWGYPTWFHYPTAILELISAGLLFFSQSRFAGAVLGALVMLAAVVTLIRNREYKHVVIPAAVLILTAVAAWIAFGQAGEGSASAFITLSRRFTLEPSAVNILYNGPFLYYAEARGIS